MLKPLRALADLCLPEYCVGCRENPAISHGLCRTCWSDLPRNTEHCPTCAQPMRENRKCGRCILYPPPFRWTLAPLVYRPPTSNYIQRLKYHGDLSIASMLGRVISEEVARRAVELPDLIIPVPLHVSRMRRRGFNQANEIARAIGRELDIKVKPGLARRVRSTPRQIDLRRSERRKNLRGAFRATPALNGVSVAVVDDVITTGSTVSEFAAALGSAGVSGIQIWSAARAT